MNNPKRKTNGKEIYVFLKTKSGIILGALLWVAGYNFSRLGFTRYLGIPESHWLGYLLGVVVTWLQGSLNEGTNNHPTLYVSGILSYVYGIFTNIMGLMAFQLVFFQAGIISTVLSEPFEASMRIILTVVLGVLFEVLPEHMITYGLFGESYAGDLLRSVAKGIKIKNGKTVTNFGFKNVPVHSSVPEHSKPIPQRKPLPDERSILLWIEQEYHKNNKNMPSYSRIVKNTSLTSTSKVKPYVERFMERIS